MLLHKTKGLNPRMTFCPRCGGEANELILVGANDKVHKCEDCGMLHIGAPKHMKCQKCGKYNLSFHTILGDSDKLPASQPCDACQKEIELHRSIIAEGGIYWKCAFNKNHNGVIKPNKFTIAVRSQLKVNPPSPCGIEFTQKECPVCSPKE